jgi:3-methylfumaryl-CoA hydratase
MTAASETTAFPAEELGLSIAQRVAAMLDIDPKTIAPGDALPHGWHFPLLPAITRRSQLRSDGFAGLGVDLPDLGLPRLMLGGRSVVYRQNLVVGEPVERRSGLVEVVRKGEGDAAMAFVTVAHDLLRAGAAEPAVSETQRYVMLAGNRRYQEPPPSAAPIAAERSAAIVPDSTLLFQYSALGFNSHRIHLDRDYARDVEGFPDLVVNGGLATLLLTEFARVSLGISLRRLTMKNTGPLFCDRSMTLAASRIDTGWQIRIHDDAGRIAATTEVEAA